MPNQDHRRPPVTLEQLLRLKRAEQPSEEFWNRFERELHQKQLAALVERRPWWHRIPQFLARRTYLPISVTAILAFTLVSVKFYAPTQLARVDEPARPTSIAPGHVAPASARPELAALSAPTGVAVSETSAEAAPRPINDRVAVVAASATTASATSGDVAGLISWSTPRSVENPTASARNIAANIARLEQTEPDLVSVLNGHRNLASSGQSVAEKGIAEFATFATNTSKRGRLLAQFNDRQFTPEPKAPEIVRERLARHLADPDIANRLSRIGIKGDQVSLGVTLRL